jgi:ABC transport system ATP-binding/permease protein
VTAKAATVETEIVATPKPRRLSYNEQRELALLPGKIQHLEAEQLALQTAIGDPALFQHNNDQGAVALQRLQAVAAEIESAYSRWDALDST